MHSIWVNVLFAVGALFFLFLAFKPGIVSMKWYHKRYHQQTLIDHCTWCDEVRENEGSISRLV